MNNQRTLLQSLFSLGTLLTGLVAIAVWSQEFDWVTGVYLVVLLYIHEAGHVLAARWRRVTVTSPPLFVPGLGAFMRFAATPAAVDHVLIILGGPLLGGLAALAARQAGIALGQPSLAFAGDLGLLVNFLNLAPIVPLDGGQIATRAGWLGMLPALGVAVYSFVAEQYIVFVVAGAAAGLFAMQEAQRNQESPWKERLTALGFYLAAAILLAVPLVLTERIPWLRALPQPFQQAERVFVFVLLGFWVIGRPVVRHAFSPGRSALERYLLLTFGGWLVLLMYGGGWQVACYAAALAQSLGLPGLGWLERLAGFLARRQSMFAGSAAAVGYDCLMKRGRTREAEAWLETQKRVIEPAGMWGHQVLFGDLTTLGYPQKAAECLLPEADGRHEPESVPPLVCNNLAWVLYLSGRSPEAVPYAWSAARREPRNSAYLDTLGHVLLMTGDAAGAEEYLRKSVNLQQRVVTLIGLARALAAQGKYNKAAAAAQQAFAVDGGVWSPDLPSPTEVRRWIEEWKRQPA